MLFLTRLLMYYAAISVLLLIAQMAGYLFAGQSLLHIDGLTDSFVLAFAKREYALTHSLSIALALLPAIAAQWRGARSRENVVAVSAGVLAGMVLVAGSWGQAVATGRFATLDSYSMALTNPFLMFAHALHFQPLTVWGGLTAFVAFGAAGVWYAIRMDAIKRPAIARAAALCFLLSAVVAQWTTFSGPKVGIEDRRGFHSSTFGQVMVVQDFLEQCYQSHTGPLTSLYCNWANRRALADELSPNPILSASDSAIVSADDWGKTASAARRPNVLFLVIESLRADVILKDGAFRDIMPNVTALAKEGAYFQNHYALATHSNYADIVPIASQYPLRSAGTHVYPSDPTYPTPRIYDLLKTQGYRTAIISSQNEEWGKMINYLSSPKLDHFFHAPTFDGETYVPRNDIGFFSMAREGKRSGKIDDYHTVNEAIRWIGEQGDEPVYIYSNYQNSHFPYEVPESFPRPFAPEPFDVEVGFNNVPDEHLDIVRRRYYDSLYYIDHQIGRLIQSLKKSGRYENTLFIITGDTGQAFREHGFSGHANMLFDETLRTPLVLAGPGIRPEIVADRYCHLDVPPTILAYLGLPRYPGFQGIDALDRSAEYDRNRVVFLTVQSPFARQYGVLLENIKYFTDETTGADYLFLLDADPAERHNLAHVAPEFAAELKKLVNTWRFHQLDYYSDLAAQAKSFPPALAFAGWPGDPKPAPAEKAAGPLVGAAAR